jgi:hypothetical protein
VARSFVEFFLPSLEGLLPIRAPRHNGEAFAQDGEAFAQDGEAFAQDA